MMVATIATQRSGTKYLGSLFSSGSQVSTFGEIFNPDNDGPFGFRGYLQGQPMPTILEQGAEGVLDRFFSHFEAIRGIYHFDIFFNQTEFCCTSWNGFRRPFIYGYLRSRSAIVIILKRDIVETFCSLKILEQSGEAHRIDSPLRKEPIVPDQPTVLRLKRSELDDYRDWIEREYESAEQSFYDYEFMCPINYQDIAQSGKLPSRLTDMIKKVAAERNVGFNSDLLQLSKSVFLPSRSSLKHTIVWED